MLKVKTEPAKREKGVGMDVIYWKKEERGTLGRAQANIARAMHIVAMS
jgi:hypothetical protein